MRSMKYIALPLLLATFVAAVSAAQETAPRQPACTSKEHRQFDFWVGEWTVTENGKPAGFNRIELILGDCALAENWHSATGYDGKSFTFFDAARGVWHQTWIDQQGQPLYIEGGWRNGAMVLEGDSYSANGKPEGRNRISWTVAEDGSVRQLWQHRKGDGEWRTLFDGRYVRAVTN